MSADRAGERPRGEEEPLEELVESMYDTLRDVAQRMLRRGRGRQTIDATDLVHEGYIRLSKALDDASIDRVGFVALAATAIRHALVDQARRKGALKRGGALARVTLHDAAAVSREREEVDLLDLDQALEKLAALDERQSRIVELRFFGGLTNEEVASVLGVTRRTVSDDWAMARAWLKRELSRGLDE